MGASLSNVASNLLDPSSPVRPTQTLEAASRDHTGASHYHPSKDHSETSADFIAAHERRVTVAEEYRLATERSKAVLSSKALAIKLNRALKALHEVEGELVALLALPASGGAPPTHQALLHARSLVIVQALNLVDLLISQSKVAILCATQERHIVNRKAQIATSQEMALVASLERHVGEMSAAAATLES